MTEIQPKIVNTKKSHHQNIIELPENGPKKSESCYYYDPSQNEILEPLLCNTRCTTVDTERTIRSVNVWQE